jgi:hypothetical protein
MTLYQEAASVPKSLNAHSADTARFQAILAGLVVVLMAVAVASSVIAGRPTGATIEDNLAANYANGYPLHGGLAGPSRIAIDSAGSFAPGYPLHGGLAGPSQVSEIDEGAASIRRFLLPDDQAAAGSSLRFAPQAAEGATDGDNQRFVQVD